MRPAETGRQQKRPGRIRHEKGAELAGLLPHAGVGQNFLFPGLAGGGIAGFAVVQPLVGCQRKSGFHKTLADRNTGPLIHIAGTGAPFDGVGGAGAEQRKRGFGGKRQQVVFVFQQDKTFGRGAACQAGVGGFIRARGGVGGAAQRPFANVSWQGNLLIFIIR